MSELNKSVTGSTIENLLFVITRSGARVRLLAGLGINVLGAGVLLAHGVRFLG